ncbi:hypothetical protein ACFQVB_07955 [Paraburkholderia humisilvae]|uniref:hypothetical protein n=1 Tax=Paraburkholderia humisilvae TaxID=627669 RepID=UPI00360A0C94
MRAVRFHCAHDIRVENVPDPTGMGADQMIVKPLWCGICGTDLHEYRQDRLSCRPSRTR